MGSKGFMHAMEGIIAALLLLTYTAAIFQYPQSYSNWVENKQEQVSREYLSSFNDAGLSGLIVENRPAEFVEITRNFLGVRYSYGLYTEGLVPQNLVIGVLSNESVVESTSVDRGCAASGVPSDNDWCRDGTFKGLKFVLVDNDTGVGNNIKDYDSIYFDSDDNGTYDKYEGPRSVSNAINVSGEMWIFSSIHDGTYDVEFIRGEDVLEYRRKISNLVINNRQTNISIRARTNESDIIDLDVLIIPRYMSLVHPGVKHRLNEFLDEKKSIIEVANITKDNFDEVQEEIFGLQCLDIDTVPAVGDISIHPKSGEESTYDIGKYFYFTNMKIDASIRYRNLNMSWINSGPTKYDYNCYLPDSDIYLGYVNCTDATSTCVTYTIDGIVNYVNASVSPPVYCKIGTEYSPDTYYYAEIDIRKRSYPSLVVNTIGSGYDGVFIDLNRDRDLTNDGGRISAGDTFKIGTTNFTLRKISEDGRYIEIRPVSEHKFADTYPGRLYSVHNDTEYIILEQGTEYNSTAFSIGDKTAVGTAAGTPCTDGLLTGSGYKKGSWLSHWFTITNISKGFNVLNIDIDGNNVCDDLDEGPFYTGDLVRVGPEYFRVDIAGDGSKVDWTLAKRWRVPSAIVSHKSGLRKTAWMMGEITSDDEWHILRSIILWSIDQRAYLVRSSESSDSVLVKSTFVANTDMFQPYKVYFRTS